MWNEYTVIGINIKTHRKNTLHITAKDESDAKSIAMYKGIMPPYEIINETFGDYSYLANAKRAGATDIRIMEELAAQKMAQKSTSTEKEPVLVKEKNEKNFGCLTAIAFVILLLIFGDFEKSDENENVIVSEANKILFRTSYNYYFAEQQNIQRRKKLKTIYAKTAYILKWRNGGSWEKRQNYKISKKYSDAQHRYGTDGDHIGIEFDKHGKLRFMDYYNGEHNATVYFYIPLSYCYSYLDLTQIELKKREVKRSCKDSWDAVRQVMNHTCKKNKKK